jgi:hypothetical protein
MFGIRREILHSLRRRGWLLDDEAPIPRAGPALVRAPGWLPFFWQKIAGALRRD